MMITLKRMDGTDIAAEKENLRGADLRGANLRWANLRGADLRWADLRGADLRWADLRWADLRGADLRWADLRGADLGESIGNGREIIAIQTDIWTVTRTAEIMQIGCQRHPIERWWEFTDAEIAAMDTNALEWWRRWKRLLQQMSEVAPAVPTKAATTEQAQRP